MTRASLQTGPGGLAAPNGCRATSSNAINELVPVPNNATSFSKTKVPSPVPPPSPDSLANLQPASKNNATSPTDVMKHHLLEDVPVFPSNQTNPTKEDPQALETLTMPAFSNHFIGSSPE
ncbi:hypothetical protein DSO57_1017065 [Entomophthora muscae]|uniref:Uncharacterized protein n=1 Tax=Entomophthora muscae TaxID=34485 RepID=A0ACC2U3U4_9FUNG|nr:hypothetical protein DSO57_1017065 [Entomophthora muscae]